MNMDKRETNDELCSGRKKRKGKAEGKLAGDHPRRPARFGTDVGRCFQTSGRQGWLEEMHCPMYSSARDGLRSTKIF